MSFLKRLFRRGTKPDPPKTREFDIDLDVQFTDKVGRVIPNVKVTHSSRNDSPKEKFTFYPTDDLVISPEAALENAFTSPENLYAVATAFDIWTLCLVPNFIKQSAWCAYAYLDDAYRNILSRQPDRGHEQISGPKALGEISKFDVEYHYFEFQYMRFIHKAGLFDSPSGFLTPEHVDRLVSCGWLTDEDFDFDLGRLMLARGAHDRVARQTGQSGIDGMQECPLPWSIDKTIKKVTAKDILEHVSYIEAARFGYEKQNGEAHEAFTTRMSQRPQINSMWIEARRKETGLFGLKSYGISDKRALELIRTVDASYVSPDEYSCERVYDRIAPHMPSPSELLDPRLDEKLPEPRQNLIVPDIYVTDPPYGKMEVDDPSIPLYLFKRGRPLPRGYELFEDRKIVRLPPRHCQFLSNLNEWTDKTHPLTPRQIITPKCLEGALGRPSWRSRVIRGWDCDTSTHGVNNNERKRSAPIDFDLPARKRRCIMVSKARALRRHETTLVGFNSDTQQPIVVGGRVHRRRRQPKPQSIATRKMVPSYDSENEVAALVVGADANANSSLHTPPKKFKRRQRESTATTVDYERPMKKARNDIDYSIPQPEPTPEGAEPVRRPLFVGGEYTSYEPEDVKQQREEQHRQREAADPLLYLDPRNRSDQMQPWFSDLEAKVEFIEIGPGLIMMESTGRIFEYSTAECMYKELMPLPGLEPSAPTSKSRSKRSRSKRSKSTK